VTWPAVAIFSAAFLAVFGLVIWFLERRKGRPTALTLMLGLPGVYLAGLPFVGAPRWLSGPGLVLLIAGYLVQLPDRRRSGAGHGRGS
jgi:hypothetical protein